ncbi:hypothetical protein PSACC_03746 [Paramicrosporidium saccamoebae]|uniref:Uncharacterized protein n=1 Tax=Paramicrosporidium saccamoebae TaxID=1246581 RepID=A0A2H9TF73_9FUNG|nr:hypothetical protein PSACC_03746 [Paramicrosporidium saccamoebae]
MKLPTVVLSALVFVKYCNSSSTTRQLICTAPVDLQYLDNALQAAGETGANIQDVWSAALGDESSRIEPMEIVKEALRWDYNNVLRCAQIPGLLNWKHPRDYHWLYARSYHECWFAEDMWKGIYFNWIANRREILKADNVEFFKFARGNIASFVWFRHELGIYDAAKIGEYLREKFDSSKSAVKELIPKGHVNTLRLLHKRGFLHEQTADSALLPTTDELRDQPVEYVKWVCHVDENYLSPQDLISLCTSHTVGLELAEWIDENLRVDLANHEMASAAAKSGHAQLLNWVCTKNPSVFISKECIKEGLGNADRDEELFTWALCNKPECLPEWEFLDERGYRGVFPEMVKEVKLYQERQKLTTQGL